MKNVTPLFINLHWLPIAARIKFKALMFAYKTTSGSAPLYLNSLLQTYVPLEASVLQMNVALLFIPKRHKITFTDFYIKFSFLVEWPAQLNPSSWVLRHLQESAKNTSLPSLFDPLTLALSILILFLKKKKKLVPFRLALCPFTACFLKNKTTNTSFSNLLLSNILSVFFLFNVMH